MSWQVVYHPDVGKEDIPRIPQNLQSRIRRAIESRIESDPISYGKPLRKSLKGHRKLRVGDYRVIYRIEKNKMAVILVIGHREEVYKKVLKRV